MLEAKYNWEVLVDGLVKDKDVFSHILKNRQINDLHEFFSRGKEAMHHPGLLQDMQKAKERILRAISAGEKIVVYGDYDCDGITSLSLLVRALKKLNACVEFDLPDRFLDGYGLNMRAAQDIISQGASLVITVDNGITCVNEVALLQENGIDVIITDHHEPKEIIPQAYAIIHPKLSPLYPFKDLAGVGVAYKLACAVLEDDADDLLDLVMIGTIADMMPLIDENQAMINLGIAQLKKTKNLGLRKILQHSHLDIINETAIAFKIAPKINSSGRMNKAKDAVRLLTSTQESEANKLILEMELHHSHRKEITDDAYALCETLLDPLDGVIVVASPLLHEGIIGICAQKLVEKYQKTTCVIYVDDQGVGKGSMRAFGDDNALDLLQLAQDLLSRFGGHSQAAGFQLPQLSIPLLKARLNQSKKAYSKPVLRVDMEVLLKDIEIKTIVQLETYSFFTAKFLLQGLTVKSKTTMTDKHTKLVVSDGLKMYDAVLFNSLEYYYLLNIGDKVDIVGGLNVNSWKNTQRLQIMIKDLRCTHFQLIDFRQPSVYSQAAYQCGITQEPYVINDLVLLSNPDIFKKINKEELQTVWLTPAHFYHDLIKYSNRVGLGELYRFVQTHKTIPLSVLQQKTGIHNTLLKALVEVFVQMKLISIVDESIHYLPTYLKQDLEQSLVFQRFKKSADFIVELYQSDESTLKSLFNHYWEA